MSAHLTPDPDFASERALMVARQIVARGVADARVLGAMARVPREAFTPRRFARRAYQDRPLPIGAGQTISQPFIVARMIELAEIAPDDRVLEVGAGSGYAAAVMAQMAARVIGVERIGELAERARGALARLAIGNVEIIHADGGAGWPAEAPYDAIIVSAGALETPGALRDQLSVGGVLVIPLASGAWQTLTTIRRLDEARFEERAHEAVKFVPLVTQARGGGEPSAPD